MCLNNFFRQKLLIIFGEKSVKTFKVLKKNLIVILIRSVKRIKKKTISIL